MTKKDINVYFTDVEYLKVSGLRRVMIFGVINFVDTGLLQFRI